MAMSAEAKKLKSEYNKKWAKNNPDKVRKIQERYWEKRLAKMKAKQAEEEKTTDCE